MAGTQSQAIKQEFSHVLGGGKIRYNVGNSIFLSFLHHSHFLCFISHIEVLCTTTIMGMNFKRIINFTLVFFFLSLTFSLSRKYFRSLEP